MSTAGDALCAAYPKEGLENSIKDSIKSMGEKKMETALSNVKPKKDSRIMRIFKRVQNFGPKFKILISLYQILNGVGVVFNIPFPPFYERVVSNIGGLIQIEIPSLMPLDCIVRTSYYSRLIFKCIWRLCVYLALGLLACKKHSVADLAINLGFLVMFVVYPSISSSLLSMFYCVELEDGTSWLRVDLSLECATEVHTAMLFFTWIMICIHVFGTPGIYAYLFFWKYHSALEALKEQEINDNLQKQLERPTQYTEQKAVVTADAKKPRLDPEDLLPGYMISLTSDYEYRTYWFELFETLRKLLLVGVPSTFPERGGLAQLFVGLLVCFTTFGAYMLYTPFVEDSDDALSQLAQAQIFLTLLSSLAPRTFPPSKLVGDLITAILFIVPCMGVLMETSLFSILRTSFLDVGRIFSKAFPNFKPPRIAPYSNKSSKQVAEAASTGSAPKELEHEVVTKTPVVSFS